MTTPGAAHAYMAALLVPVDLLMSTAAAAEVNALGSSGHCCSTRRNVNSAGIYVEKGARRRLRPQEEAVMCNSSNICGHPCKKDGTYVCLYMLCIYTHTPIYTQVYGCLGIRELASQHWQDVGRVLLRVAARARASTRTCTHGYACACVGSSSLLTLDTPAQQPASLRAIVLSSEATTAYPSPAMCKNSSAISDGRRGVGAASSVCAAS